MTGIDPEKIAEAVQQVAIALTDYQGADCLLYAHIGAGLLRSLGIDVRAVAGSASWRVGLGDSDVISHAREIPGALYFQGSQDNAAMFHAWIEGPGHLIDLSTVTLKTKAAQLDAADGGVTCVDWAPAYLWLDRKQSKQALPSSHAVVQSFTSGVFNYTRHADIETKVLSQEDPDIAQATSRGIFAAQAAYSALLRGERLQVIGLSEDGSEQTQAAINTLFPYERNR